MMYIVVALLISLGTSPQQLCTRHLTDSAPLALLTRHFTSHQLGTAHFTYEMVQNGAKSNPKWPQHDIDTSWSEAAFPIKMCQWLFWPPSDVENVCFVSLFAHFVMYFFFSV